MAKNQKPEQDEVPSEQQTEQVVLIKARVLVQCSHGKPDDVIEIDAGLVEQLAGVVDASPEAVAYAESLQ